MTEKVQRVSYYSFEIEDSPGTTAGVLGKLREASVNLLAYSAFPTSSAKAQVTVVPERPDALEAAARSAGLVPSAKKECFLIQGDDRIGAAHDILKRLAEAKINCVASTAAASGTGSFGMAIFVKPADLVSAAKALGI